MLLIFFVIWKRGFYKMKKNWLFLSVFALLMCGCAIEENKENTKNEDTEESKVLGTFVYNNNGDVSFTDNEFASDSADVSFDKKVTIKFDGAKEPTVSGFDGDVTLKKDETRGGGKTYLIINSSVSAEYEVSGTCEDGALLIFSEKKFKLTLNGLTLKSTNWPAINIQSGKRCFVEMKGENSLAGAGTMNPGKNLLNPEYVEGVSAQKDKYLDCKATLFSEGELIFKGTGLLNVTGNAKHAICSDDYVRVLSGKVNVTGAPSDGIHANDAVFIHGGEVSLTSSANGIECEDGFVYINGGKLTVKSGKTGIKTPYDEYTEASALAERPFIFIEKGDVNITTSTLEGDGIDSANHLVITGGKVVINAEKAVKGLVTGSNDESTVKGDIVIAKDASVEVNVKGASSGAVAVKAVGGIYLHGESLTAVASGNGGRGLCASDKIVITGGKNEVTAAGVVLDAKEMLLEEGADLLAIGSDLKVENVTAKQKYVTGGYPDISIAVGDSYEITADKKGEFKTALSNLKMLFTYKDLTELPKVKIKGTESSDKFQWK
jgi:hypothetical protein